MLGLAEYEKTPDAVNVSVEDLEEDGFGETRYFYCQVAELGSSMVGFVLYSFLYSTWEGRQVYMEDLYVEPEHRRKGVGTKVSSVLMSLR